MARGPAGAMSASRRRIPLRTACGSVDDRRPVTDPVAVTARPW